MFKHMVSGFEKVLELLSMFELILGFCVGDVKPIGFSSNFRLFFYFLCDDSVLEGRQTSFHLTK